MGALAAYHFGHLPVWVGGNAYFGGASVSKHETTGLIDDHSAVKVDLICEDGRVRLDTNICELVGDFRAGIITSDLLGCAFEPEQRFENPDGTAITFDRDYFGDHRGLDAMPGPFADAASAKKPLW